MTTRKGAWQKMWTKTTVRGLANKILHNMRTSSRVRGHHLPCFVVIADLEEWLLDHPDFERLWSIYLKSGALTDAAPSIDRLVESKPYTLDNIRLVSWRQNRLSSKKIDKSDAGNVDRWRGVRLHRRKWYAKIGCHPLGSFDNPIDAARAYDRAAKTAYGSFATLNGV